MAWLSGWSKRKKITLTGGSSGAQTAFQIMLTVTYDSDMQADFDDLRFTKADGTTLIDAWLEEKTDSTSANVWAEFPTTPANTVTEDYYMYYGKSDAASDWDIGATFLFGDDFPGSSIDTNKWTVVNGTWTVANNVLSTSNTGDLDSVMTYAGNIIVECSVQRNTNTGVAEIAMGSQRTFVNIRLLSGGKSEIRDKVDGARNIIDFSHSIDTWYKMKYQKVGTSTSAWIDDNLKHNNITVTPTGSCIAFTHSYSSAGKWKEFRVRKYAANPATYGFGSEENEPTGNSIWYFNMLKRRNA